MICLKDVYKEYGEKRVLTDITSELPDRGLTAFIGSNGAGKSTMLNIIGRILEKDGGTVKIDGKNLENWNHRELAKRISILSQANHLNIRLTVRELVEFGRFPYSRGKLTPEDIKKVDETIAFMGLDSYENRYLDQLSGGQRQMAYIAMVICQDTKYIFLDEPLNNLDMKHSAKLMRLLKTLIERDGKVIYVVIHDVNFVSTYADYIVALKDGKLLYEGTNEEIVQEKYLTEIFDFNIRIVDIDGQKVCLYYKYKPGEENIF